MKYFLAPFLLFVLASCTAEKVKQEILVEVNSQSMSVKEFAMELTERMQGMDIVVVRNTEVFEQVKKEVVFSYVRHAIVKDWAEKNGVSIEQQEVNEEVQKYRANYPDDISFRSSLADEGLSYERWNKKIKKDVLERKVFQKVTENVAEPTNEEIRKYYYANKKQFYRKQQYKVKQIVLAKSIDAEKLYKLIKKRGSFEKLAREYSIGAEAQAGGLLGWIEKGVSSIFDSAAKLPLRSVTKPIKSDFGYHIVQVVEKRSSRQLSLREVEDTIRKDLIDEIKQKHYNSWFEGLKKEAKIRLNEEMLASMTIELKNE